MKPVLSFSSFLIFQTFLLGCSFFSDQQKVKHPSILPPERFQVNDTSKLNADSFNELPKNEQWWHSFQIINQTFNNPFNNKSNCDLNKNLASDTSFPIYNLAKLLYLRDCASDVKRSDLPELTDTQKSVYRSLIVEIELKISIAEKNNFDKVSLLLEQIENEKSRVLKREKIDKLANEPFVKGDSKLAYLVSSERQKWFPQFLSDEPKHWIDIGQDFLKDRQFTKSKLYFEKVIKQSSSLLEKNQAFKLLFKQSKTTQDKEFQKTALTNWGKWILSLGKSSAKWDRLSEWSVLKARWIWTEGDPKKAQFELKKLISNKSVSHYQKKEAYYTLGRIYEEQKKFKDALSEYNKSADLIFINGKRIGPSDFFEKNFWSLAWLEFKIGNFENSQKYLQVLLKELDGNGDAKYQFWNSICFLRTNKKNDYEQSLKNLIQKDPLSFYSALAHRELKISLPPIKPSALTQRKDFLKDSLKNALTPVEENELLWLLSLNQNQWIESWAKWIESKYPQYFMGYLVLYAQAGQFQNLLNSISKLSNEQRQFLANTFPELLFPDPYLDSVTNAANKFKIPASFIYSIMRQESAFNPMARSSVDALGLLQLMPSLGQKLAKSEGLPWANDFDLYKPDINIQLGAKELAQLFLRSKNKFIPAIAGYNSNPVAYSGWLESRGRPNPIEFIEEIPYEETRTYIKLILRNMLFYERIYFRETPWPFPEEWLRI